MKFSRLSAAFLCALLLAAFLFPLGASAHSVAAGHKQVTTTSCPYAVRSVSNSTFAVVAFANNCVVQDLDTISPITLTTLLTGAGVANAPIMTGIMILDRGVIQATNVSCFHTGVNVGYELFPIVSVSVTCP